MNISIASFPLCNHTYIYILLRCADSLHPTAVSHNMLCSEQTWMWLTVTLRTEQSLMVLQYSVKNIWMEVEFQINTVGFCTSLIDLLKLPNSARPGYFPNSGLSAYYIKTLYTALCEIQYWCHTVVNVLAQGNRYRKQRKSVKKKGFILRKTSSSALMHSHSPKTTLLCPKDFKIYEIYNWDKLT